jgi:hypothetical protein
MPEQPRLLDRDAGVTPLEPSGRAARDGIASRSFEVRKCSMPREQWQ